MLFVVMEQIAISLKSLTVMMLFCQRWVEFKMGKKHSFCSDQSVMIKCLWSEIMTNYIINQEESAELLISAVSLQVPRRKLKSCWEATPVLVVKLIWNTIKSTVKSTLESAIEIECLHLCFSGISILIKFDDAQNYKRVSTHLKACQSDLKLICTLNQAPFNHNSI